MKSGTTAKLRSCSKCFSRLMIIPASPLTSEIDRPRSLECARGTRDSRISCGTRTADYRRENNFAREREAGRSFGALFGAFRIIVTLAREVPGYVYRRNIVLKDPYRNRYYALSRRYIILYLRFLSLSLIVWLCRR